MDGRRCCKPWAVRRASLNILTIIVLVLAGAARCLDDSVAASALALASAVDLAVVVDPYSLPPHQVHVRLLPLERLVSCSSIGATLQAHYSSLHAVMLAVDAACDQPLNNTASWLLSVDILASSGFGLQIARATAYPGQHWRLYTVSQQGGGANTTLVAMVTPEPGGASTVSLLWAHCASSLPQTSTHININNVDAFITNWVHDWAAMPADLRSMAAMWGVVEETAAAPPLAQSPALVNAHAHGHMDCGRCGAPMAASINTGTSSTLAAGSSGQPLPRTEAKGATLHLAVVVVLAVGGVVAILAASALMTWRWRHVPSGHRKAAGERRESEGVVPAESRSSMLADTPPAATHE